MPIRFCIEFDSNMKQLLLFPLAVVLFFNTSFSQNPNLIWSTPIEVATGSLFGTSWPRIVLTENDVPVIMWGQPNTRSVFVSRLNSGSFTNPVRVVPQGMNAFIANWAGPDMAASGDSVFVTFKAEPIQSGKVFIVRSTDGGLNFSDTIRVDDIGSDISDFPSIELAPGGNPVVTFMHSGPTFSDPAWEVTRSQDGGNTFSPAIQASGSTPGEACDCCPTTVELSGNLEMVPFRNNDNNIRENYVAVSTNGGISYDTVYQIDTTAWFIPACPSQGPDAAFAGDTAVTIFTSAGSGTSLVYATAMDVNTWSMAWQKRIALSSSATQERPRIIAKGDTLAAMWEDYRNGDSDVYFVASVRGPSGLLTGAVNAGDPTAGRQENPDMAYANNVFHIVYRDAANVRLLYRTATMDGTVAVEEKIPASFKVYPNPSQGSFALEIPKPFTGSSQFSLLDLQGRTVLQKQVSQGEAIVLTEKVNAGIYFGQLENQGTVLQQKIILY